jgi:hypothetical protein
MKPKYVRNAGKPWTRSEVDKLRDLAQENTPTRVIGLKLGRPEAGIRAKAAENSISLKPNNRAPYSSRHRQ